MLTLFSVPKPFRGREATIQRNALDSWSCLGGDVRLILAGRGEGIAEAAAAYDALHLPDVAVNEYGTPLIDSVFAKASDAAETTLLAYVNADIVLLDDVLPALRRVDLPEFLLVGRRWNLDLDGELDIRRPGWQDELRERAVREGELAGPIYVDYFFFPRGTRLRQLPAFAVGRPAWDNWLIFEARRLGVPVVDATAALTAVHQNHGYDHVPQADGYRWTGPEARANWKLAEGTPLYSIGHATHVLTRRGLRRALAPGYVRMRWRGRHEVGGGVERLARATEPLLVATRPVRRMLDRLTRSRGT